MKTQNRNGAKRTQQKRLDDFEEFKPFFECLEKTVKRYRTQLEQRKQSGKKTAQKNLFSRNQTKKGSGLMTYRILEVEYLENGKKKEKLIKSSREEVEFWNRQRRGEITIISATRQEKNQK